MNSNMGKRTILKKTIQAGSATFLSRLFGIVREVLFGRFLGVNAISDAFLAAFKIPVFLRKLLAEGALSAASVPIFVKRMKEGKQDQANSLMTVSFIFFEGFILLLCVFVFFFPDVVLRVVAPGFSAEQINYAVPFLRIMFPMILFISSSALLASALQAANHFFIPAFAPVLLNISLVTALILCLSFDLSAYWLCFGALFGSVLFFLAHLIVYFNYNFNFFRINETAKQDFWELLRKFIFCLFGVGIVEINLYLDMILSSYLPKGSVSLVHYAGRFMNIPLGVLAISFSTVLLSQLSRISLYAPSRLKFYVLESAKFITFLVIPSMLFLIFSAEKIFSILMFGKNINPENIFIAKWLLIIYCTGLVFFSLNKIFVNVFYSLKDTFTPTIALAASTIINFIGNIVGMYFWGIYGLAGSTVVSAIALTFLCLHFLKTKHGIIFYSANFFNFIGRFLIQILLACAFFIISYFSFLKYFEGTYWYLFFSQQWGYWFVVFTLAFLSFIFIFFSRKIFGLKLYFLSK
ncbi:MAG: murein biosynthesis integral membrane protein MurJ [bacterium]